MWSKLAIYITGEVFWTHLMDGWIVSIRILHFCVFSINSLFSIKSYVAALWQVQDQWFACLRWSESTYLQRAENFFEGNWGYKGSVKGTERVRCTRSFENCYSLCWQRSEESYTKWSYHHRDCYPLQRIKLYTLQTIWLPDTVETSLCPRNL